LFQSPKSKGECIAPVDVIGVVTLPSTWILNYCGYL